MNTEVYVAVLGTLAGVAVLELLLLLTLGGGSLTRLAPAWQLFVRVLRDQAVADRAKPLLGPPEPPRPVKRSGEPLRLLALLQREGRLLDFLLEDIAGAPDELVGAGVRELHRMSQAVLKEHLDLEPVLARNEGDNVEVPAGFDPSAIRVTGNVAGQPPFHGVLKHHGWRVKDFRLPAPPAGQDEFVLAPAEVDIP